MGALPERAAIGETAFWQWYEKREALPRAYQIRIETILEGRFNSGFKKPGAREGLHIGVKLFDLSSEGMPLRLVA